MNKKIYGYSCILYEEDKIEAWDIVINGFLKNYKCALSPLHDMDKENKPGCKNHYHLAFFQKLTTSQRQNINFALGYDKTRYFEPMYDELATYKYLYHSSDICPDKFHYNEDDVKKSSFLDVSSLSTFDANTGVDKVHNFRYVISLIKEYDLKEYALFLLYLIIAMMN